MDEQEELRIKNRYYEWKNHQPYGHWKAAATTIEQKAMLWGYEFVKAEAQDQVKQVLGLDE